MFPALANVALAPIWHTAPAPMFSDAPEPTTVLPKVSVPPVYVGKT